MRPASLQSCPVETRPAPAVGRADVVASCTARVTVRLPAREAFAAGNPALLPRLRGQRA